MGYGFHDFFLPDGLGIYHELQTKIVHVVLSMNPAIFIHWISPWLLDCFIIHFWRFHPFSSICSPSKFDMAKSMAISSIFTHVLFHEPSIFYPFSPWFTWWFHHPSFIGFHPFSSFFFYEPSHFHPLSSIFHGFSSGDGSKPWYLVNPKIAGKWMFIPLKMYL